MEQLHLEVINPLDYRGWDDLLLHTPKGDIFYTAAWAKVLNESYGYQPLYLALVDHSEFRVLLPFMEIRSALTGKRGISLPFTDFCEPLMDAEIPPAALKQYLIDFSLEKGWKYFELRGAGRFNGEMKPSVYFYNHSIHLTDNEEKVFAAFRGSMKRNIKKAAQSGLEIRMENSPAALKEYYKLHCLTRQKHGLPPQPYHFFRSIFDHIISKNMGNVVLAEFEKTAIAGAIFFHFGDQAIYKFGASDMKYQHLRANNLVMWEAIRQYARNGYRMFSFGRTEPNNKGLRQFKTGWGAEEKAVPYFKYDLKRNAFIQQNAEVSGFYTKIFNRMPIPVLKSIGNVIYKHIA